MPVFWLTTTSVGSCPTICFLVLRYIDYLCTRSPDVSQISKTASEHFAATDNSGCQYLYIMLLEILLKCAPLSSLAPDCFFLCTFCMYMHVYLFVYLFYPLYIFFIKDCSDLTAVLEGSGMHQKEHVCTDSHRNVEDGIR